MLRRLLVAPHQVADQAAGQRAGPEARAAGALAGLLLLGRWCGRLVVAARSQDQGDEDEENAFHGESFRWMEAHGCPLLR
ncbi:hypothetical protein D3C87_1833570 [compost metagenome]